MGHDKPISKFAMGPNKPTSYYSRKLDHGLGLKKTNPHHYTVQMAGYNKYDDSRTTHPNLSVPFHESLVREVQAAPEILNFDVDDMDWADDYWDHPIVKDMDEDELAVAPPLPCALYVDGFPYTKDESAIGFVLSKWAPTHGAECLGL